jgi:Protein of unknown function (DUF3572)
MREASLRSGGDAELTAIKALEFIASRPEEFGRFLALSGVDPADLRQIAGDIEFLGGVLDFLLADEALLLVFSTEAEFPPHMVADARRQLDAGRALESGED